MDLHGMPSALNLCSSFHLICEGRECRRLALAHYEMGGLVPVVLTISPTLSNPIVYHLFVWNGLYRGMPVPYASGARMAGAGPLYGRLFFGYYNLYYGADGQRFTNLTRSRLPVTGAGAISATLFRLAICARAHGYNCSDRVFRCVGRLTKLSCPASGPVASRAHRLVRGNTCFSRSTPVRPLPHLGGPDVVRPGTRRGRRDATRERYGREIAPGADG